MSVTLMVITALALLYLLAWMYQGGWKVVNGTLFDGMMYVLGYVLGGIQIGVSLPSNNHYIYRSKVIDRSACFRLRRNSTCGYWSVRCRD